MILQKAAELHTQHNPFVLVTIIKSLGSTPRHQGKMIVKADGSIIGTIGGGPAEARAIQEALERLASGESGMAKYTLNKESGSQSTEVLPMECGGGMELLFEVYGEAPIMALIGGGHVNYEIGKLGAQIGYRVVVVDKREEFSSSLRFPFAWKCITTDSVEELFNQVALTKKDVVVIATPDHDESSLRPLLRKPLGFLGMIGSRNKVLRIKQRLLSDGFTSEEVAALRSPVGIDIGAETPLEIAISVLSEILAVMTKSTGKPLSQKFADLVVVRGGGDLATGVAHSLFRAGFSVVVLEQEKPTVIRRTVSFADAIFSGVTTVEGITARCITDPAEFRNVLDKGEIPVLVDPQMGMVDRLKPTVLIDATLAKKNRGVSLDKAGKVIALGPGFVAGKDVHMVIETARGHYLGAIITQGASLPDTGVPGSIAGYTEQRIVRAPATGYVEDALDIGVSVAEGDTLGYIMSDTKRIPIVAPLSGVLRGMIHNTVMVREGMKIGDVDPRNSSEYIYTISDKARAIGGAALQAVLMDIKE